MGQRPAAQRAGRDPSGGKSPLAGRFNITLRYANRRSVTALAMLPWAKGVFAGKRHASPSLRVTSRYVLRPRKSKSQIKKRLAWARVLRTPAHGMLCAFRACARAAHAHKAACALARPRLAPDGLRAARLNRCAVQAEAASWFGCSLPNRFCFVWFVALRVDAARVFGEVLGHALVSRE